MRRPTDLLDLFRRARIDREIDEELRFHLDAATAAGVRRGLSLDDARAAARASLDSSLLSMREQMRDARGASRLDGLRRDLRHSTRMFRRNPGFSLLVIGTLAVAIGSVVTAFSVADAWLFRPLSFPAADRLVVAFAARPEQPSEPAVWMPYRAYLSWRDAARSFSSVSAAFFQGATWRGSAGARSLVGMRVTPDFFTTFGVPPFRGRALTAADATGPPAVVISHGFWQRELGGADGVLGTALLLSDVSYTVVGIMPAGFDVRLLDRPEGAAFWTPFRPGDRGYDAGGLGPVAIVARLTDGAAIEAARAEVAAMLREAESAYPLNFNAFVVNLSSLQADNTRTVRSTLLTVLAAALCLLLIAATNAGVLLLGRGLGRRGEVAVRYALGAGRATVMRQLLTESLVLAACGGVVGIGLAVAGTRLFLAWNPLGTLPANAVQLDLRAMIAATASLVFAAAVAGLVPAIRVSGSAPAEALHTGGAGRTTAPAQRAQRVMLTAQIAVSMVLVACAALLTRTFLELRAEPLGFVAEALAVATIELPTTPFVSGTERYQFFERLEAELLARPGVRGVAAGTSPPLNSGPPSSVHLTAIDSVTAPRISTQDVTSGFFSTLDVPLVAGRAFDRRDGPETVPVVILNARAATDLFGSAAAAIGQRLRLNDEMWREVVGVVGNVRTTFFNTLEWRADPIVYRPAAQAFANSGDPTATSFTLRVHVRSERPLAASEVRDATLAAGSRAAVIEWQRVSDLVADATKQPTFRMTVLLGLCGASLLLAAVGVYGLVTQAVTERLREIAIRLALGADPRAVTSALVRHALWAGVAGLTIGGLLAIVLGPTLESLLYGVRTGDVTSLSVAALLLLGVIGLAAWVPALRATRVDPVRVLRCD